MTTHQFSHPEEKDFHGTNAQPAQRPKRRDTSARATDKMIGILKEIMDEMDACVYVSDLETDKLLFVNRKLRENYNVTSDFANKTCWQLLQRGAEKRCSFCPIFKLEQEPGRPVVWEECSPVTGRRYKNTDSIIEWTDGKKVHLQHSIDITDIISAREESQGARERLEMALTASNAGVWDMMFDRNLVTYDERCARLFGFDLNKRTITVEELVFHLENTVLSPSGVEMLTKLRKRELSPDAGLSCDLHLTFPDGTERYLRNYASTVRDMLGKSILAAGMCIDITEHVAMEKELKSARDAAENANRAKSQFLSNMSHEIRTPMNAVLGITDILMEENLGNRQAKYLNDIKMSATSLLGIINDILDFSKIEAGKFTITPVDFNLVETLDNLNTIFSASAKAKNIAFSMKILNELPSCVYGDDIRIRQVLVNILGNAVKFTNQGGVTFSVGISGNMLLFEIRDTGIGIKTQDLDGIFKNFSRLDIQKNRDIAGTGLGLAITRNLITLMDGTVSVESEYGKGSAFHVRLPLIVGDRTRMASPVSEREFFEVPDASVLVVDDNRINLSVATGLLKIFGIVCDTASNGLEAIRKIGEKRYDIVFMDQMMPEMDGAEATRVVREKYGPASPIIIALTANAVEGAKEQLLSANMNDYLSKPIDKARLGGALQKWLPADKLRFHKTSACADIRAAQ